MVKQEQILDKIKQFYKIKRDAGLAKYLNVSTTSISLWRNEERKLDLQIIFSICKEISANWLLFEIGNPMIEYEKIKDKEIEKLKRENEELREKLKGNDNVDNKMLELRAKNEVMADLLERIIGKK